jgi:predicted phage terminase large subunit-like protein
MAVDLSGFDVHKKSGGKTLDQTAIAVAEVGTFGWYVHDIVHGRWDVRETAIRILRTAQHYRPLSIGIERGALKSAIMPYLHDNMLRFGVYPSVTEVSHGGRNKQARIQWALQGLMEQRRLYFRPGAYMRQVREEMADFPNRLAHDDALDALSYIAQLATVPYNQEDQSDEWQPFDAVAGF